MKFYLAIDSEGRKQLRGTKELIVKVNKTFEVIEIPTDKEGLEHLVQDSFNHIFHLEMLLAGVGIDTSEIKEEGEEFFEGATLRTPSAPSAPAVPGPGVAELSEPDAEALDVRLLEEQVSNLGLAGVDGLERFDGWEQTCGISAAFQQGVALLNIIAADDSQIAKIYLRDKMMKRIKSRTY